MNITKTLFLAGSCAVDCGAGASSKPNAGRLLRTEPDNGGTRVPWTTEIK